MIEEETDISPAGRAKYDAIIDVRSPAEFEEDRLPGAINLPVLSNDERAEVGTIYKQDSPFKARRIGAAYVARNVAAHLNTALADKPGDFRPLLYCWRGGMRSGAMATILSQVGWRVGVLKGGYKTWRRAVVAGLRGETAPLNIILLDGQTGTAKSAILARAEKHGAQVLDLETLAAHRGSVFGALPGEAQPGQKLFESRLWEKLSALDPQSPILVEAESSRVGARHLPRRLWLAMLAAPRIEIRAEPETRARYLVEAYGDFISAPGAVSGAVERLTPFQPKTLVEEWREMNDNGAYAALAESLMREHYDPLYARGRKRRQDKPLSVLRLDALDDDALDKTAEDIVKLLKRN